jgi:hypothetical protein
MVFDPAIKPVGGKRTESPDRPYDRDRVKKAMESGLLSTDIDKTGSFLSPEYRKLKLYAPLWSQGKVAGAVRMEVLGDVDPPLGRRGLFCCPSSWMPYPDRLWEFHSFRECGEAPQDWSNDAEDRGDFKKRLKRLRQ